MTTEKRRELIIDCMRNTRIDLASEATAIGRKRLYWYPYDQEFYVSALGEQRKYSTLDEALADFATAPIF